MRVICLNPMLHRDGEALIRNANVQLVVVDGSDDSAVRRALPDADAVIVRLPASMDAERVALATRACVIAVGGAGTDHVDLTAATATGIPVVNNSGAGARAVAEHAVGLMLAVVKRIPWADRLLRAEGWSTRENFHGTLMGGNLWGARLGLVGFGHTAAELARICRDGFGMTLAAYARPSSQARCEAEGVAWTDDLLALCREADVLSVHVPYSEGTHHLVGPAALASLRPGSILVNTARGAVVDGDALYDALLAGRLAGAGLDVFEQEPLPREAALLRLDSVVATPHIAGISRDATRRLALSAARQVLQALAGERPLHLVNPQAWPSTHHRNALRDAAADELRVRSVPT